MRLYVLMSIFLAVPRCMAQQPDDEKNKVQEEVPLEDLEFYDEGRKFSRKKTAAVATKSVTPIEKAPATVSVISREEIVRMPVRFLTAAFRKLPGFEVQRLSATEASVGLRGFNSESVQAVGVLALVDGRPVFNNFFGNALWDFQPVLVDDIKQVEVIRGPGSFVHGANAMHGVVSILTTEPEDYAGDLVETKYSYGAFGSSTGAIKLVTNSESEHLKLLFAWDDIDDFVTRENTRDHWFGTVKFNSNVGDSTFKASAGAQQMKFSVTSGAGTSDVKYLTGGSEEFFKLDWIYKGLTVRSFFGNSIFTASPKVITPQGLSVPDVRLFQKEFQVEPVLVADTRAGKLTAGTGVNYLHAESDVISHGNVATYWFFAQLERPLTSWLTAIGGVRMDHKTYTRNVYLPKLALIGTFPKETVFRASYGKGYRNPSLVENFSQSESSFSFPFPIGTQTTTTIGNKQLSPEQLDSWELAFSMSPLERVKFGLAGFYNKFEGEIATQTLQNNVAFGFPIPSLVTYENVADSRAQGIEAEVSLLLTNELSLFANHSYTVVTTLKDDSGALKPGERRESAPLDKGNYGLRFTRILNPEKKTMVNGDLWATYFGDTDFPSGHVPSYHFVNARVGFRPRANAELFLGVYDILDSDHQENPRGNELGRIWWAGFEYDF